MFLFNGLEASLNDLMGLIFDVQGGFLPHLTANSNRRFSGYAISLLMSPTFLLYDGFEAVEHARLELFALMTVILPDCSQRLSSDRFRTPRVA